MNYRHIYHAGNICDVVKHATLALIVRYMQGKDKGFAVLDTHAGCGLYDLQDERALKTNEAAEGILKLWSAEGHDLLTPYLDVLRGLNADGDTCRFYTGSPMLARRMLRPQDRLIACELHPDEARALKGLFFDDPQAQIHARDGYDALKAFLPFPEKRGLILIDPPFETGDEIANLVTAVTLIQKRAPQTTTVVWYPIKDRPAIWNFHEALRNLGGKEGLIAEFIYRPEVRHDRLNGTGLVVINPPFTLEAQLQTLFPALHALLETEAKNSVIKSLGV